MKGAPAVAVVLVNWNGWRETVACLDSCRALTFPQLELIVVDNGSTDDSVTRICAAHPDVTLLRSEMNLGFAGGNNIGIRAALDSGAQFVWLLNNDTEVAPNAATALVEALNAHPCAGAVGSKIFTYSEPPRLWYAGGYLAKGGAAVHIGLSQMDSGQFDSPTTTEFITGCSMMITRPALTTVGLLTEDYFLYWEDVDYSLRLIAGGFDLLYAPGSVVRHKEGGSGGGSTGATKIKYLCRNMLLTYARHAPSRLPRALVATAHQLCDHLREGQPDLAFAALAGLGRFLIFNRGEIRR